MNSSGNQLNSAKDLITIQQNILKTRVNKHLFKHLFIILSPKKSCISFESKPELPVKNAV
jgi:hypothetical protein